MTNYIKCPKCGRQAPMWSDDFDESYFICDCQNDAKDKLNEGESK